MKSSVSDAKKVIYDQDGLGLRDHNLYGLLLLLQAPSIRLVGLTTVSGREWSPRQLPRAVKVMAQLGRTEIPVAPGAVFPLLNSPARCAEWETTHGRLFDRLCHDHGPDTEPSALDPFWLPPMETETREARHRVHAAFADARQAQLHTPPPPSEPAAAFLVRMAREHPGELSIVATGPLTNLALACRLDPQFPGLVRELIFVGGRFRPRGINPPFTRGWGVQEVNFRHDPEAAHIVLQADWKHLVCLPRDLTDRHHVIRGQHDALARRRGSLGRFVRRLDFDCHEKGDALAAAVCIDSKLITASDDVFMDVDLDRGAHYGATLGWRSEENAPALHSRNPVHVVTAIDEKAFDRLFCAGSRFQPLDAKALKPPAPPKRANRRASKQQPVSA